MKGEEAEEGKEEKKEGGGEAAGKALYLKGILLAA